MMNDAALIEELKQLTVQRIGLAIPDEARFMRIFRERALHLGHASLQDYRNFLVGRQTNGEWEYLARSFATGETFFFRDHGQFDLLRLHLLPELIARNRDSQKLRLWSAGCASGEEVYSLAMLVDMLMPERDGWDILILGTDINSEALAKARRGKYGKWSFRMIPPELQQRYFNPPACAAHVTADRRNLQSAIRNPQSEEWLLDERIRRMVTFRVSNLVVDVFPDTASEFHDMDLILCRNVFIYFDHTAVSAVAAKFAATLREGGYLLTAHTELMNHKVPELESRLLVEGVVYQRRIRETVTRIRSMQVREDLPRAAAQVTPRAIEKAKPPQMQEMGVGGDDVLLLREARALADGGDFEKAEQACRKALASSPLAAEPYLLLAQLADVKGDSDQARDLLNKALYLSPRCVAAHLELATIYERSSNMPRAHALRRAALSIVRSLPADEVIAQYETTAADLLQWLEQWYPDPGKAHSPAYSFTSTKGSKS